MNREMVEGILGLERAAYAWTIDNYPETDGFRAEEPGKVLQGPREAPDAAFEALGKNPKLGEKFRMKDDDGIVYFEGRILIPGEADTGDGSGDVHEAPLWDIGESYGCVTIEYRTKTEKGGTAWKTW